MKLLIFIFSGLILLASNTFATSLSNELFYFSHQAPSDTLAEEPIFVIVQKDPVFKYGKYKDFPSYVRDHIQNPKDSMGRNLKGSVMVTFVVEKNGEVSNVSVMRPVNPLLDREAIRVVQSSPLWKPGMQKKEPVRVRFNMAVVFGD
jgi:periplasmic protein TonB